MSLKFLILAVALVGSAEFYELNDKITTAYVISPERLQEIRKDLMYWFDDSGGPTDRGDYVADLHSLNPLVHKNLPFNMPVYGFRFNYTRVSLHGILEFSDQPVPPQSLPFMFPNRDWPLQNDPSFIGIFLSRTRIGSIRPTDSDRRTPGMYFRYEHDLSQRMDEAGVEVRERTMWDIREGIVGAESFVPEHVIIVTWKNMSFAGGISSSLFVTNTFQIVLATDEQTTYAIFNYPQISWTSHTEAGGDTVGGLGGIPAYVGFNSGNASQSFEYKPYSQSHRIHDLTTTGFVNNFPGRHIFRIDEQIRQGSCSNDIEVAFMPLHIGPESGNMLGGTIVNITGPCFAPNERITCRFDSEEVIGYSVDTNRAICVQPFLKTQGYIRLSVAVGDGRFNWHAQYFVEAPDTATEFIFFDTNNVHLVNPTEIGITWSQRNLTANNNAAVMISLWGYRQMENSSVLVEIDVLADSLANTGHFIIKPDAYSARNNEDSLDLQFGFIRIHVPHPEGIPVIPMLWSRPIPLAWYFDSQWTKLLGDNWPEQFCQQWLEEDEKLADFQADLPKCPCDLEHALLDKGRFMPDLECDRDSNPTCLNNRGAVHCVRAGYPSRQSNSEQQCCYDRNGFLMLSHDQVYGSQPKRSHNFAATPTLTQWYHDIRPSYSCCRWQNPDSDGCLKFRVHARPTQDCVGYESPAVATVFGDPHFITFDNLQYTFNGMGEFVLVRGESKNELDHINIQGRFEQTPRNIFGAVAATQLTSIAAMGTEHTVVEVRLRPRHARWRYHLDVLVNSRRVFFDRPSMKFQNFPGVTVYTPTNILNQSEVVIMFSNGVGVQVVEYDGSMAVRAYLPQTFINKTTGLFGNWSHDTTDDLTLPDGTLVVPNLNNFESIHKDFGLHWMLSDRMVENVGNALFTREFGRTASFFANATFLPNFIREIDDFLPPDQMHHVLISYELCGDSYQCRYDYGMTFNRDTALYTLSFYNEAIRVREINERRVISCGVLKTPQNGRKSSFLFVPGATVYFECNDGFVLRGDSRRVCGEDGQWSALEIGETECVSVAA